MPLSFDQYTFFAAAALLVASVRYTTYLISIYRGQTKPHAFSWFLWGLMVAIGAVAQFSLNSGLSAYVLASVSAFCFFIAGIALFMKQTQYTRSDWLALIGACAAIPIWAITKNPLSALLVLIVIDSLSYYPTFRKTWQQPSSEPPISYFWAGLRYFLLLFSIPEPTWQNLIYPIFLMVSDWGFMLIIFYRRWQLGLPLSEYSKRASS